MIMQMSSVRDIRVAIQKRAYKRIDVRNGYSSCLCVRASPNKAHHFPARKTVTINRKQPLMFCPTRIMANIVSITAKTNLLKTCSTWESVGGSYNIYCNPKTTSAAYRSNRFART